MAKPGRNTIILGGLAVVAVLGWLAWDSVNSMMPPSGAGSFRLAAAPFRVRV